MRRLTDGLARRCDADVPLIGNDRAPIRALGSDISHPDTPENASAYSQLCSQAPRLGFPLLHLSALVSLATGMFTAIAHGPNTGKENVETALLCMLFDRLQPSEVY